MRKKISFLVIGFLILSSFGAVAINVEKEQNNNKIDYGDPESNPRDYTHTVLVEVGSRKGCPSCPQTNAAWKSIYGSGDYDFEYTHLIYQSNPKAYQRFITFNPMWVPTSYFDGGQYVCVGTDYNTFYNYLNAAGSRSVPDLIGEVNALWLGDAKIDISISIENNDNDDYPGSILVYVVELVSTRWTDYQNQPYGHALLDFPWNEDIDINSGDTLEDNKVWDGAAAGYGDITPDNIQVILAVFDDTPHTSYSDPPGGNPFNAYYADEVVATLIDENQPPEKPTVSGPTAVDPDVEYEYSFVATDPNDNDLSYFINWGDELEGWLGPYPSGKTIYVNHSWSENGIYEVKAKARDEDNVEGPWSDILTVIVGNIAPDKPEILGKTNGNVETEYMYRFISTDINGDNVMYHIDWDDGNSETTDFYPSGTVVKVKHNWSRQGTYTIKARAEDTDGGISPEGTLSVTMPRNKAVVNTLFQKFFQNLPNLFPILRLIL